MALLPLPAALSITAAALLAPHTVATRRRVRDGRVHRGLRPPLRGARQGTGHGRVHVLLLHAVSAGAVRELPWMIGAVAGGHRVHVRDERLRDARSARTGAAGHHSGAAGPDGDRRRHHGRGGADRPPRRTAARRMRARTIRLNETALMVQGQIEDKADPARVARRDQRTTRPLAVRRRACHRMGHRGRRAAAPAGAENPAPSGPNSSSASPISHGRSGSPHPTGCEQTAQQRSTSSATGDRRRRRAGAPPRAGDHQRRHSNRRSPRDAIERAPRPDTDDNARSPRRGPRPERRAPGCCRPPGKPSRCRRRIVGHRRRRAWFRRRAGSGR